MSENPSCACGRTHCCSCAAQLYDEKIVRLEAEVAALRKERDEARFRRCLGCEGVSTVLSRAGDNKCDTPMGGVSRLLRRAESAESRLSALAAAAREFKEAEGCIVWTRAEQVYANVERFYEAANALDALLSGEEGR